MRLRRSQGRRRYLSLSCAAASGAGPPDPRRPGPCASPDCQPFWMVDAKNYWHCEACEAVVHARAAFPAPHEEHANYLLHHNDPAYRRFPPQLGDPLMARLEKASRGLDYGCGPGPGLAAMLREAGHSAPPIIPSSRPIGGRCRVATASSSAARWRNIFTSLSANSLSSIGGPRRAGGSTSRRASGSRTVSSSTGITAAIRPMSCSTRNRLFATRPHPSVGHARFRARMWP